MIQKQLKKGIEIFVVGIMILGLMFLYVYKTFNLLDMNLFSTRYFYYVFMFSLLFFTIRAISAVRGNEPLPVRIVFSIFEIAFVVYYILVSSSLTWAYVILSYVILYTTICYGNTYGFILFAVSSTATGGALFFNNMGAYNDRSLEYRIVYDLLVYSVMFIFWYLSTILGKELNKSSQLVEAQEELLKEKVSESEKLKSKIDELKDFNNTLEAANRKLENTNQRLNKSAAEFYTLQQISQAIATILDIKELLKFVNDVIIGVMGVNYSTIMLLDKVTNKLTIKVTNIYSEGALTILKNNIDATMLKDVIKTGNHLIDNNVNEEAYSFTKGRGVQSLLCIPLSSKNESYGLVLVEQERPEAFEDDHIKFLSAISNQISIALENVVLYEKMQQMATTDALTKIYNRLYFNEMLSKEMAAADRENYPMSISIFDIDHFKKFNDTYGHLFGDLVLKTIAKLAKEHVRANDVVARFGGEEFVIIMPNTPIEEAQGMIEELRDKISKCHIKEGSIMASVTASFGIAHYPGHGLTEAEVLSAADTALYKAKTEGRNCVKIYEKEI